MSTVNIPEEILDDHTLSFGAFKVYCKLLQYDNVAGITLGEIKDTTTLSDKWWNTYIAELEDKGYIINKYIFNHRETKISTSYKLRKEKPKNGSISIMAYFLRQDGSLERVELDTIRTGKTSIIKEGDIGFEIHQDYIDNVIGIIWGNRESVEDDIE